MGAGPDAFVLRADGCSFLRPALKLERSAQPVKGPTVAGPFLQIFTVHPLRVRVALGL